MKNQTLWPFVGLILILAASSTAHGKLLFEGYYKITSQQKQIGYYIQRYELDSKKKQFISTYYFKTNQAGGNIAESLRAVATPSLKPIAYQYTSLQGTKTKTIDATFKDRKMTLKITEDGKLSTLQRDMPEGTFLSTFLTYMLLQGEKGIQKGVKYAYKAVAEEDSKVYQGEVYVEKEESHKGLNAFKILNTFKKSQFVNYVTSNGESLSSYSPVAALGAELVATPSEALQGFETQESSWKIVFGGIPTGKENVLSKKGATKTIPTTSPVPSGTTILIPPGKKLEKAKTPAKPAEKPAYKKGGQ